MQKGKSCSIEGCDNWCSGNDLCDKHRMALRRYGNVLGGKIDRKGICLVCGKEFKLIKSNQKHCNHKCYRQSQKGKDIACRMAKNYRERNKEKVDARDVFRRRPFKDTDSCLVCGTTEKLHRHHHDYRAKMDVTVLCRKHHMELHGWDSN